MAIVLVGIHFDYVDYDERGDTLFVSVEAPNSGLPEEGYETPEGHSIVLDDSGSIVSIELISPRRLLERHGEVRITLPAGPIVATRRDLAPLSI
jgi:uncharacterized protein YuzE